MWTRELIKTRAKEVLRLNYWKAFVISLVIAIVGGNGGGGGGSAGGNSGRGSNYGNMTSGDSIAIFIMILSIVLGILLFVFALRILLGYPLEVGGRKFFIRAAEEEINMGYLGYCFKEGRYPKVVLTMLLRGVYVFLWSLLLIIPGIIKSYSYRMVPYILADNPSIGYNRAIELSSNMTRGEKWNIFVLDLSFIGWYLLGLLALGIGILFVNPYYDATNAELYLVLRKNAIDSRLTTYGELNLQSEYINN